MSFDQLAAMGSGSINWGAIPASGGVMSSQELSNPVNWGFTPLPVAAGQAALAQAGLSANQKNMMQDLAYDSKALENMIAREYAPKNAEVSYQSNLANLAATRQKAATQSDIMQILQQMLIGGAGGTAGGQANVAGMGFGGIQSLLDQASAQRAATYAPGSIGRIDENVGGQHVSDLISRYQDLANGPSSQQWTAMLEQGRKALQNNYLTNLRQQRISNADRGLPPTTGRAQESNLLRQRLQAEGDLQQSMILDQFNNQKATLDSLNTALGQDIARRQAVQQANAGLQLKEMEGRLGNPELPADLLLKNQQNNAYFIDKLMSFLGA